MSSNITIKKFGLRFKPPAIIVYYEDNGTRKLRERIMPLNNFDTQSNVNIVMSELRKRNEQYLNSVTSIKLERLARIIQEQMMGNELKETLRKVEEEFSVDPEEDLNKVDDDTLQRKKDVMNEIYEANRKRPGDPDFQYDVEINFDKAAIESSEWDSDKDDLIF